VREPTNTKEQQALAYARELHTDAQAREMLDGRNYDRDNENLAVNAEHRIARMLATCDEPRQQMILRYVAAALLVVRDTERIMPLALDFLDKLDDAAMRAAMRDYIRTDLVSLNKVLRKRRKTRVLPRMSRRSHTIRRAVDIVAEKFDLPHARNAATVAQSAASIVAKAFGMSESAVNELLRGKRIRERG
jgi:hypothetical protein